MSVRGWARGSVTNSKGPLHARACRSRAARCRLACSCRDGASHYVLGFASFAPVRIWQPPTCTVHRSSPSSSLVRTPSCCTALSEAQGWSMDKNMACSKERTMERHCLTLHARMQPKFARSRARRWPHQRHPHAGRRSLKTEVAAMAEMATKSCGRWPRACVQGQSDG